MSTVQEVKGVLSGQISNPFMVAINAPDDPIAYELAIDKLHAKKTEILQEREAKNAAADFYEPIECHPLDGAVALARVLKKHFGWCHLQTEQTFFGPKRPTLVSVQIGVNETVVVPWGKMSIPGIEGAVETKSVESQGECYRFALGGTIKKEYEEKLHEIAKWVREEVANNSIFKGKALRMNFRDSDGDRIGRFSFDTAPKFMDVSKVQPSQLILNEITMGEVQVNLFVPIERSQECRDHQVPLKRGVLLAGPYGTGKTLTANITAKLCEQNGWTFMYVSDARDIDLAIRMSKLYAPAVVFAEDCDDSTGGERDSKLNEILNTMDGIDTKNLEIITILTTNNVEKIHPACLRPGRIDAVIEMGPSDVVTCVKLIRSYGNDWLRCSDEEIADAIQPVVGQNPAFIREIVERAKMYAINRFNFEVEGLVLTAEDLNAASNSMANQIRLHSHSQKEASKWDEFGQILTESMKPMFDKVEKTIVART